MGAVTCLSLEQHHRQAQPEDRAYGEPAERVHYDLATVSEWESMAPEESKP